MQINILPTTDSTSKICWHTEDSKFAVYGDKMQLNRLDGTFYSISLWHRGVIIAEMSF